MATSHICAHCVISCGTELLGQMCGHERCVSVHCTEGERQRRVEGGVCAWVCAGVGPPDCGPRMERGTAHNWWSAASRAPQTSPHTHTGAAQRPTSAETTRWTSKTCGDNEDDLHADKLVCSPLEGAKLQLG
eukprot:7321673-Prymnesium_polylepis.2